MLTWSIQMTLSSSVWRIWTHIFVPLQICQMFSVTEMKKRESYEKTIIHKDTQLWYIVSLIDIYPSEQKRGHINSFRYMAWSIKTLDRLAAHYVISVIDDQKINKSQTANLLEFVFCSCTGNCVTKYATELHPKIMVFLCQCLNCLCDSKI